ncbi:MAG: (d)CMP kinase [bacterium]
MESIRIRKEESATAVEAGPALLTGAVIAIDGPAGSGKSTTARYLAQQCGLVYIDTGAMYRALTWAALGRHLDLAGEAELATTLRDATLELRAEKNGVQVRWNDQNISAEIRTPAIDNAVSQVSAHAAVRREMVERQRCLGRSGGVVMEGRDIGSVVFPLADAKIYLDASLEARVERRFRQYRGKLADISRDEVRDELAARDRQDSERKQSPLIIPPDAMVLDTSQWSLAEQNTQALAAAIRMVQERLPRFDQHWRHQSRLITRYRIAYGFMTGMARFYGLRHYGREHLDSVPSGTIMACNHVSWWDPPLVGSVIQRYPVGTLAKAELFKWPPSRALFNWLDAIPIQRAGYDGTAFAAAVSVLQNGGDVLIFPEGTRRPIGRPGPVRSGLGILLQEVAAPAVPIFIRGSHDLTPGGSARSPLEVRIAPRVDLRALPVLRRQHDNRVICKRIAGLFQAIFEELQARSFADFPQSEWERQEGERQREIYRARERKIFGRRRAK